jgi:Mg-chelatase subunit ChlD
MEFAATGRHHDRMWRRRQLPHRIAPALVLLADRSSSMQGPRAEATFASAVILAEVCRRAGLPLSVVAYHTQAKVLLGFGDTSAGRSAAGSMEGILQAEGGTRIVPALEAADALIATSPHREHLVICIADGEFDDRERTKFEAITSRWSRSAVRVAGLGLGPQTEGIARWFSGAKGNLQPSDLSGEVTRLISSFVSELYGLRAAA